MVSAAAPARADAPEQTPEEMRKQIEALQSQLDSLKQQTPPALEIAAADAAAPAVEVDAADAAAPASDSVVYEPPAEAPYVDMKTYKLSEDSVEIIDGVPNTAGGLAVQVRAAARP